MATSTAPAATTTRCPCISFAIPEAPQKEAPRSEADHQGTLAKRGEIAAAEPGDGLIIRVHGTDDRHRQA
jgi:hypothetical protein